MDELLSVDQVAERLGLQARTVRTYVRDGRLPATRIGKQYRIAARDLDAFTGTTTSPTLAPRRVRHSEASSIVEIDAVDRTTADRISTLLTSAATTGRGSQRLRIDTIYDEERGRMKVVVLGGLADTARLFDYIEGVLGS